ncbi:MAG: hypothetical protein KGL99_10655 [Burkholderiales bacterium]|nr:hypothetical protein [Burkholderiales bacterium]MDE2627599.1 hypothetical protein [Burkholderiales bacterium]
MAGQRVAQADGLTGRTLTGSLPSAFEALALALVVYGVTVATAVASGAWFRDARPFGARSLRGQPGR